MDLTKACTLLDIMHVARARAEVWTIVDTPSRESFDELKVIAKNQFKVLAMTHHPDKPDGSHEAYLEIQEALRIVKEAQVSDFIDLLSAAQHYTPGSDECFTCGKWSDIAKVCTTTQCSGYKPQREQKVHMGWGPNKDQQGGSFASY